MLKIDIQLFGGRSASFGMSESTGGGLSASQSNAGGGSTATLEMRAFGGQEQRAYVLRDGATSNDAINVANNESFVDVGGGRESINISTSDGSYQASAFVQKQSDGSYLVGSATPFGTWGGSWVERKTEAGAKKLARSKLVKEINATSSRLGG